MAMTGSSSRSLSTSVSHELDLLEGASGDFANMGANSWDRKTSARLVELIVAHPKRDQEAALFLGHCEEAKAQKTVCVELKAMPSSKWMSFDLFDTILTATRWAFVARQHTRVSALVTGSSLARSYLGRRESTIAHTYCDRETYDIKWFLLADGRGWVHDFELEEPGT